MQTEIALPATETTPAGRRTSYRAAAWGSLALYQRDDAADGQKHLVVVEDIGPGGIFIAATNPPPVGTVLRVLLYSQAGPAGGAAINARAIVRWHRLQQEPVGMGVEIVETDEFGNRGLGTWIDSWKRAPSQEPS
jgi:hypothetical protein